MTRAVGEAADTGQKLNTFSGKGGKAEMKVKFDSARELPTRRVPYSPSIVGSATNATPRLSFAKFYRF